MEAILIKSVERRAAFLAKDGYSYLITAELRVIPETSDGHWDREVAEIIIKSGLTKLTPQKMENGGVYLSTIFKKEFDGSATISSIYDELSKMESELQAEFTKLMDQVSIVNRVSRVISGDKQ
jgi:hypothetical protein